MATDYVYTWINRNEGKGILPELGKIQGTGNAIYFDFAQRGVQVYDGTRWVTPAYAYDSQTGTWVPYDRVYAGGKWINA
jgi:hypothetical protein